MIDVINLKKSFGSVEVLKGINMTINKGDIVAIIGDYQVRVRVHFSAA